MWSGRFPRPSRGVGALLAAIVLLGAVAWFYRERLIADESAPGGDAPPTASFVGSASCASCHAAEHSAWSGSQHARAMQHATADTVLGNFDDATFRYAGVTSTFFKRNDKYFARTDGPDGKLADFEIKYTFGVEPLQQYLIELPGGRLQALSISWDARPREAGGQRWFHLYPSERVDHRDELHWTRSAQNWNFMCADCHSTNVRRNFDARTGTFNTKWSDIAVGCEACHGPASQHLAAPNKPYRLGAPDQSAAAQMETCAACHARRAQIDEGARAGDALMDHYLPSTLSESLYHADGQQLGEVFIWGSFQQSRKRAAGVTCAACHEPHTQKLRKPGNEVCTQCHVKENFDTPAHHHHELAKTAAAQESTACVSCHMREATYMVVDRRRDHGFHVPRPDLTLKIGTPNACNDCHADRDARWADSNLLRWYGDKRRQTAHFGEALYAGRRGEQGAVSKLLQVIKDKEQTGIVRASAIELLARYPGESSAAEIRRQLTDSDALVRYQALLAQQGVEPARLAALTTPMLDDPRRAIRHEAARQLATSQVPLASVQRARMESELADYERVLRLDMSRGEPWLNLANLRSGIGDRTAAEDLLRRAIVAEPQFVPAWVNLADVLRATGRDADAETMLREGLQRNPGSSALREVLGLALVRQGRKTEALEEFRAAHRAAPAEPRFRYVYALALQDAGRSTEAKRLLEAGLADRFDRDSLLALAAFARDSGDLAATSRLLERLRAVNPADPALTR